MGLFSCSIPPWFVLSCNLPTTNARAIWLCFSAFLSPPAPCLRLHGALTTGHYSPAPRPTPHAPRPTPHAPRSTLHAPPSAGTSGVRSCADPPHWLLPDTDRQLSKTERGPISTNDPSILSISPNQAIPAEKSIRCSLLAAIGPLTILSWPEALNASRSRRACRMAIRRNACSLLALPDFPEFAQAVRYGVPGTPEVWCPRNSPGRHQLVRGQGGDRPRGSTRLPIETASWAQCNRVSPRHT